MNPIKRRRQHGRSSNWRNEAAALVAAAATAALAFSPVDALASPAPHLIRERASARLLLGGVAADDVDPYFISIECGAKAEAKAEGVNLHWSGTASTAVGDETSVLNSIEALQPNGIILAPFSNTAFVTPVAQLMRRGVPVVTVDAPLVKDVQYQAIYTDNLVAGKALAGPLSKAIGNRGEVAILTYGAGDLVQDARWQGLEAALKSHPGIHVLTPQYVGVDSAKAAQVTTSLLASHPDLRAIFSTEGPAGSGAASALLAAHKKGIVKLFSFDAEPVEVQGLRSGEYQGLVAQSPYLEGRDAVKSLVSYLRGPGRHHKGPISPTKPFHIATPVKVLTKANVNAPSSKPFLYLGSC
jgi:ribose transport system substrate-binding protein